MMRMSHFSIPIGYEYLVIFLFLIKFGYVYIFFSFFFFLLEHVRRVSTLLVFLSSRERYFTVV